MARLSFGSLLKNPLVLGVLATEMTSNLAKSYTEAENQSRAEEADQTKQLTEVAGATGKIQTEVPRSGLFGQIGSKLGLVSPNVPLKPYQIAEEGQAVQANEMGQTEAVQKAMQARKELGPEGWVKYKQSLAEGNAFEKMLAGKLPDIPETPEEAKAKRDTKGATIINYRAGPGGSDIVELKVPGATGLFHVPPKPEKSLERIGEEATARTSGGITGKLNSDIASSPNPYYDPTTGNPVTKKMTIAEARKAGYIPASPKAVQSYNDAKAIVSELDRLDAIAQRRLPDTTNMSDTQKALTLGRSWATLHAKTGVVNLDNEANDIVNASKLPAIQLIHDIQQRYPSQIELKSIEPLLPGPRDDRQSFHEKVMRLKSLLSHGVNQGAREDAGTIIKSEGESAATDWIGGDGE
jgi:hypothetical protein